VYLCNVYITIVRQFKQKKYSSFRARIQGNVPVKLNYILFDQSVILLFIFYFIKYWTILKSFEVGISSITSELNTRSVFHTFE